MEQIQRFVLHFGMWAVMLAAPLGSSMAADSADQVQAQQQAIRRLEIQRREALQREEDAKAPTVQTPTPPVAGTWQQPVPGEERPSLISKRLS